MATESGHQSNRTYNDRNGNVHLNGADLFDTAEVPYPQSVTISAAAGSANVTNVTFQLKDGAGNALANVTAFEVWLSDAATGIGLTTTTASGSVGAGSAGADLGAVTTKKALRVATDATGKYVLSITDTGKTGFYPCCTIPGTNKAAVGSQLVTGNYG
jgi:hypothetical protein